jgi:hypothetical protein
MFAKELVSAMSIGNSVAEFDRDLESYFIETETFRSVISGDNDIVAGDKGTGKTAIFRVLTKNYRKYKELEHVEIVPAFNVQGEPIFQRIAQQPAYPEGSYQLIWKAYILSLVGNWLIDIYGPDYNVQIRHLKNTLDHLGLSSTDVSPETIFGGLVSLVRRLANPSAAGIEVRLQEHGLPVLYPKVEFGGEREEKSLVRTEEFLQTLDNAIGSTELVDRT